LNSEKCADQKKIKHLLVAGNEEILKLVLCNALKEAGYKVMTATDGVEALYMIKTFYITHNPFDLLLLDNELPKLPCAKLVERLERLNINTPTIVIITPQNKKTKNDFFHFNNVNFLEKPFRMEQLLDMIKELPSPYHCIDH